MFPLATTLPGVGVLLGRDATEILPGALTLFR
jgi:hypothetical protein